MNKESRVEINTPFIRLDAFLKFSGICGSGGEAKICIKDENITVNGDVCTRRGRKLYGGDIVGIRDIKIIVAAKKP